MAQTELFVTDPERQTWTLITGPPTANLAGTLLGQIRLNESVLSARGAWFLILAWFYSMFFRALFPTRVILALVGDKGSGKTTLLKRMGRLIPGPKFNVTDISKDEKDCEAPTRMCCRACKPRPRTGCKRLSERMAVRMAVKPSRAPRQHRTNRKILKGKRGEPHFRELEPAGRVAAAG
jgi:hypothetical protein